MDKILNLTLAYPDFQLNQVIDPDQVDLNNAQVVSKVNEISSKLNLLISDATGAGHITINPIASVDANAKNVQSVIEAIVNKLTSISGASFIGTQGGRGSTIQTFLNSLEEEVLSFQTELQTAKSAISRNEQVITFHGSRLTGVENVNSSQSEAINAANAKIKDIEKVNEIQSADIATIISDNTFQSSQVATLNSLTTNHASRIGTLETKTNNASNEIITIKDNISRINATNTNQEVVDAKVGFSNLKDRINYNEINIGANPSPTSKLNMVVTDSNDTAFWEGKIAVASLEEHNQDPTAHGGTITSHNGSSTAHEDIRRMIAEKASNWDGVQGKPIVFPPTVHYHSKNQISDFAHTHTKAEIPDFAHTHVKSQIPDFAHSHAKTEVGLGSVDNVKQMPITGGTFTGNVVMASGAKISGHIVIPYGRPATATPGSLWLE